MPIIVALASGLIFGLGLTISRMVDPAKVLGFLNLGGSWDPSLLLVMVGAIAVALPAFALVQRCGADLAGGSVRFPPRWPVDRRLIGGSVLFGIGWGVIGFCPGPALASLGLGSGRSLVFIAAMLAGMVAVDLLSRRLGRREASMVGAQEV